MAKKSGKILLLTAAVATAAAAAVYYLQKKDSTAPLHDDEDEDYDDFNDELDDDTDVSSRSYVPLHRENAEHSEETNAEKASSDECAEPTEKPVTDVAAQAEPVAEQDAPAAETSDKEIEKVEDFFDDEDAE